MPAGCDRRSHGRQPTHRLDGALAAQRSIVSSELRFGGDGRRIQYRRGRRRQQTTVIDRAKTGAVASIWQVAPTSNGRLVTTRLAATEPHGMTKDRHWRTSGLTLKPGRLPRVASHSSDGTQPTMMCSNLERSRSCVP